MVFSIAEMTWLKHHKPYAHENLIMAAGIGVGEITSLVSVGALTVAQAVKLVSKYRIVRVRTSFIDE